MSKICSGCGATVDDSQAFCPTCGAQLPVEQASVNPASDNGASIINADAAKAKANDLANKGKDFISKVKTDKNTQIMCGGIVAGIVVLFILLKLLFPSSYSVVNGYYKAYQKFDAKGYVKYIHPDIVDEADIDVDDIEDLFDKLKDNDYKIVSYEIDKEYDAMSKKKLEDLADDLDDAYGIKPKKVKNARTYTVKVKSKYDGDQETEKVKVTVAKIGMKWYIVSPGM